MNEIVRVSGIKHVFPDGTKVCIKGGIDFTAKQGEKKLLYWGIMVLVSRHC